MEFIDILERISYFAEKTPDKAAIEFGGDIISYAELNENSSVMAGFFQKKIDFNKNVFLLLDRGTQLVEAMLGVLKAGGVFIPLDPNFPEKRLAAMFEYVNGGLIITCSKYINKINKLGSVLNRKLDVFITGDIIESPNLSICTFDEIKKAAYSYHAVQEYKNCYIYFTSGSTGNPKAIFGRYRSLMHFIQWEIREFEINENFRISQLTSPSFDPFLRDVFVPLASGGTLCIPGEEAFKDPFRLIEWVEQNRINLIHIVPSLFKLMSAYLKDDQKLGSLKYIMLAGELLRGKDIEKCIHLFGDKIQLVNLYGPTETTLAKMFYKIQAEDAQKVRIPVGKPIDHTEVMILDEDMKRCRIGDVGELYIRTPFISSGYYKDKELTSKVFIKNPFNENPMDIIYKTGDLGFLLPDGNTELIGRADCQVKILGRRIEPGEIENAMLSYAGIKEAIVIDKEDKEGNKYLCCYFISEGIIELSGFLEYLNMRLPEYMVPKHFVRLENIPMTPGGKVDRKALKMIEGSLRISNEYMAPETFIEKALAEIWRELLNVEKIGIRDNFFKLGGNSLLLVRMHAKIEEKYKGNVNIMELYKEPTIENITALIENTKVNRKSNSEITYLKFPIDCLVLSKNYELKSLQKYEINGLLRKDIEKVCAEEEISIQCLLISMYAYFLGELSGSRYVELYIKMEQGEGMRLLKINIEGINDFSNLFLLVSEGLRDGNFIPEEALIEEDSGRKADELLPYFGMGESGLYGTYDLMLELYMSAEISVLKFSYNSGRLREDKMEGFFYKYNTFVKNFISKYLE